MSVRDFDYKKTPFPWFGGKTNAAPLVWAALGDVPHYVEPFFGGGAVLLRRPHEANRTYFSETVNDLNGLLCNFFRSVQLSPAETARHASWPVSEADLLARHIWLVKWQHERNLELLMGDPEWHDPKVAGWWVWGICCWIGGSWCAGDGPWTSGPDGRAYKQGKGKPRPPGVSSQLPHLHSNGQGVNHAGLREPGVSSRLPHLHDNGRGVNAPQLREPGVSSQLPHLSGNGQGVNHAGLREPGVSSRLPHLHDDGNGVNAPQLREPGVSDDDGVTYHGMVMPKLNEWFAYLSARLRHVRILNGDWERAVTRAASKTLSVGEKGPCGIFLDPPYADTAKRDMALYVNDSGTVAHDVREWCLAHGDDPEYRIVLAGYDGEHGTALTDAGWREVAWFKDGYLTGGYGNLGKDGHQQHRERLWLSPHCLDLDQPDEVKPITAAAAKSTALPLPLMTERNGKKAVQASFLEALSY